MRPVTATIHLSAIQSNFAIAAQRAPGCEPIAVVKADAYGHGAAPVAAALLKAGCRRFAVATVPEAVALRESGVEVPILVLGGVWGSEEAGACAANALVPVVHHLGHLETLKGAAREHPIAIHVEIDTGMRRMGVPRDEALALLEAAAAEPSIELEGIYTHFACADAVDPAATRDQLASFAEVLAAAQERGLRPAWIHAANSAGILAGHATADALPGQNASRPGLMLYGVRPAAHLAAELRPAMTLSARVAAVRAVRRGEAVGYSAEFRAERDTRIATLAVGYADGVPVSASGRGSVSIGGRQLPIAGRVSMDFVGVDAGDAPVQPGDVAVLFGARGGDAIELEQAARDAGTIAYELLVRVGERVSRLYED